MVVHDTSHKPFSFRRFQLPRVRELQTSEQFVKHFSCADLFTLRFPHLPSRPLGTELTENQCQSVGVSLMFHCHLQTTAVYFTGCKRARQRRAH